MKKEMVRVLAVASLAASVALMAVGCAKQAGPGDKAAMAGGEESLSATGTTTGGDKGGNFLEGRTTGPMRPVYFDFDQSDIRGDQQDRIAKNAEFLKSNDKAIRIEGNCDDRGTNEYNMALGERRAVSAKKALAKQGVAESRMETISFGEEKPLATGSDEAAWAQNRRADFAIK
ncbi:MAG: peptidoglycan-associated lipoprotein Pal [Thermodesulfobacteriota bacterium]